MRPATPEEEFRQRTQNNNVWRSLAIRLEHAGIRHPIACLNQAIQAGATPEDIRAILDHYQTDDMRHHSPQTLAKRICNFTVGQPPGYGWSDSPADAEDKQTAQNEHDQKSDNAELVDRLERFTETLEAESQAETVRKTGSARLEEIYARYRRKSRQDAKDLVLVAIDFLQASGDLYREHYEQSRSQIKHLTFGLIVTQFVLGTVIARLCGWI